MIEKCFKRYNKSVQKLCSSSVRQCSLEGELRYAGILHSSYKCAALESFRVEKCLEASGRYLIADFDGFTVEMFWPIL